MDNNVNVDFSNIDFLESLVNKDKEIWFTIQDFEFKYVEKEEVEKTKLTFKGIANNVTAQEVGVDIFFTSFTAWKNVKLKNILQEDTIQTLLETGKAKEEDLEKEMPFSQTLFNTLISKYEIGNDLLLEVHKLKERKKKVLKKK